MIRLILLAVTNPFPQVSADPNGPTLKNILNIVFGIIGVITLLFVTYGGFRYVTSLGDPQSTAKAKNTILYAVIGLVVTLLAAGIVNFVLGKI